MHKKCLSETDLGNNNAHVLSVSSGMSPKQGKNMAKCSLVLFARKNLDSFFSEIFSNLMSVEFTSAASGSHVAPSYSVTAPRAASLVNIDSNVLFVLAEIQTKSDGKAHCT